MTGQVIVDHLIKEKVDKSNLSKYQDYKMDYEIAKAAQLNEFVHNLYNTAKILTVSIIQVYKHQYSDYVTPDVITLLDYFDTVTNEIDDYNEEELVSIITGGEETDGEQLLEERSSGSDDDERTGTARERGITLTFPTTPITITLPPPIFTPYDHTKQDKVAEAKAKAEQTAKEAADKRAAADRAADKANQTTRDKVNADKVAADAKRALQEEMKGLTKDGKDITNLGWIAGVINGVTGVAEILSVMGAGSADLIGTAAAIIGSEGIGGLISLLGPTVAGAGIAIVGGIAAVDLINKDIDNTNKANTKVAEEYAKTYTEAILNGKTEAEAKAEAKTAAENTIITQSTNGEITVTAKEGGVDVNSVIKEVEDALDRVGPLITEAAEAAEKAAEASAAEKEAYEEKLEAAKEAKEAEEAAKEAKEAEEAAAKEAEEATNPSDTTTYEYEDDVPICGSDETPCSADCSGDCTSECPGDCSGDCGSDCTSDCSGDCGSDEPPCGADYCATDCSSDDCSSDCGIDIGCEGDICIQE